MSNYDWLQDLKPGDEVIVDALWQDEEFANVERITKTQIIIHQKNFSGTIYEQKFRKSDGYLVGDTHYRRHLVQASIKRKEEIANKIEFKKIEQAIKRISPTQIPLEISRKILEKMKPYVRKDEGDEG